MAELQEASTDADDNPDPSDGNDELAVARAALRVHLAEVEGKAVELAGLKKRRNAIKRKVLERTISDT